MTDWCYRNFHLLIYIYIYIYAHSFVCILYRKSGTLWCVRTKWMTPLFSSHIKIFCLQKMTVVRKNKKYFQQKKNLTETKISGGKIFLTRKNPQVLLNHLSDGLLPNVTIIQSISDLAFSFVRYCLSRVMRNTSIIFYNDCQLYPASYICFHFL